MTTYPLQKVVSWLNHRRPSDHRIIRCLLTLWWAHQNRRATDHYIAIRWLVHWPMTGELLHLVQRRGLGEGCGAAQSPPRYTKWNSSPINGQCTFALWRVSVPTVFIRFQSFLRRRAACNSTGRRKSSQGTAISSASTVQEHGHNVRSRLRWASMLEGHAIRRGYRAVHRRRKMWPSNWRARR